MADYGLQRDYDTPRRASSTNKIADEAAEAAGRTVEYSKGPSLHFETKDSGKREEYDSGMRRDTEEGKPRFDLVVPKGVPFEEQILTRFAALMARGAEKYSERNWEKANSEAELNRYYSSAFRHFMQWLTGETDEDHAAAVMFNIMCAETLKWKLANG
jgi:hypothetical protein